MKQDKREPSLTLYDIDTTSTNEFILVEEGVSAGFPSPAEDFRQPRISLDKELIDNIEATFFARVRGDSMINAGLSDGDLLVVDKSKEPCHGKIAVCFIDGEFTVKRLHVQKDRVLLMPENEKYHPIEVTHDNEFVIWGIVTYVIKNV